MSYREMFGQDITKEGYSTVSPFREELLLDPIHEVLGGSCSIIDYLLNPMRASRAVNLGSDRRVSNLGSTFAQTSQLERS